MSGLQNLATPVSGATVFVPAKVPLLVFVPIAAVIFPVNPFPARRSPDLAVTSTAGVIAVPAVVVLGCTLNTNCVAVPAVMLNAVLVPVTGPGALAVSVYPVPTLSIDRPVNVATPPDAAWVAVPDKAPPDGLVPKI